MEAGDTGDDTGRIYIGTNKHLFIDKHPWVMHLESRSGTWNTKLYGNRRVILNGRVMMGQIRLMWWYVELLSIATVAVFLWEHDKFSQPETVVRSVLFSVFMTSSYMTLCSDPGVVKKPTFDEALANAREAVRFQPNGHPMKEGLVGETKVLLSYCPRCHVYRPLAAAHCNVCDSCVNDFDHHCPVLGVCIGRRNLRWLQLMVVSGVGYYALLLICASVALSERVKRVEPTTVEAILSASITFDVLIGGAVIGLCSSVFVSRFDKPPYFSHIV